MVRMSDCECSQAPFIQLSPFIHQVGGHSSIFQYDQHTVCKLLEAHELDFYQRMPEALKQFTAEFRGIATVQYCEDESGYIKLIARPLNLTMEKDEPSMNDDDASMCTDQQLTDTTVKKVVQLRCSKDGRVDYSNSLGMDIRNYEQGKVTMSVINPWALQLCRKQAEKLHRQLIGDENASVLHKYILLENVTARFLHPCILDLKMGQRQYADIDCETKRQSKIQKCQLSTSSKLGVRLCGMQVYQIESGRYIFTDKYRGRILSVDDFHVALIQYFQNGHVQRLDVLPAIIERLEALYATITTLSAYRFYSGSLLIVYDGSPTSDSIDARMIDFAHTTHDTMVNDDDDGSSSSRHVDPDKGYLHGLECLLGIFREILKNGRETIGVDETHRDQRDLA